MQNLSLDHLRFLADLPLQIHSSLDLQEVIGSSLRALLSVLEAETGTVYLRLDNSRELTFWGLVGDGPLSLEGKKISMDVGIVGWVVRNGQSTLVADASNDERFFSKVDQESGFKTVSVLCAPLKTRNGEVIGAVQAINKTNGGSFSEEELAVVERFSFSAALAIHNAMLFRYASERAHQLAVIDRRKQEMMWLISHELRTPLCIVQTGLELLNDGNLKKQQAKEVMLTLKNGLDRLTGVLVKLRDASTASKKENNQKTLAVSIKNISCIELINDVATSFSLPISNRNLTLILDINQLEGITVKCDPVMITIALRNLIANAIRFTPDNGQITLAGRPQAGLVEISVTDNGIGISKEELPLIFEKFYEVAPASNHSSGNLEFRSGGLGLGLAAAKSIIEAHGSAIQVSSKFDPQDGESGSTFSFCLPTV